MKNETEDAWVKRFDKEFNSKNLLIYREVIKSFIRKELSSTEKATRERCAEELDNLHRDLCHVSHHSVEEELWRVENTIKKWRKEQER